MLFIFTSKHDKAPQSLSVATIVRPVSSIILTLAGLTGLICDGLFFETSYMLSCVRLAKKFPSKSRCDTTILISDPYLSPGIGLLNNSLLAPLYSFPSLSTIAKGIFEISSDRMRTQKPTYDKSLKASTACCVLFMLYWISSFGNELKYLSSRLATAFFPSATETAFDNRFHVVCFFIYSLNKKKAPPFWVKPLLVSWH